MTEKPKRMPRSLAKSASRMYEAVWVFARECRNNGLSHSEIVWLVLKVLSDEEEMKGSEPSKKLDDYFKNKGLK